MPLVAYRYAATLLAAYRNERALDQHYRRLNPDFDAALRGMPDFKPMALLPLKRRFGRFTHPLLLCAATLMLLRNLIGLVRLIGHRAACRHEVLMVPTVPSNRALLQSAAEQAPDAGFNIRPVELTHHGMVRALNRTSRWNVACATVLLYRFLLQEPNGRLSLALHARDTFDMLTLVAFSDQEDGVTIWTEDHYQRWAYVLSHSKCRLRVAQHGFFDETINFPDSFGKIDTLGVRSEPYATMFGRYFHVVEWFLFSTSSSFDDLNHGSLLLLASSSPHIDAEIDLLERLRNRITLPIAVKLHPAHRYDARSERLLALADIRVSATEKPRAEIFVSWNSFMEFDYQVAGTATWSIDRGGGAAATAAAIIRHLTPPGSII
ncbi:hypothetical protein NF701_17760 (plasmid) [Sphingomonadaceae bacterium OTU29THOMA1]|nr:hypothetical protein NF701_17760 [Sphingomonadaceae bacterium OTU29THOMA1]